MEPRNVSVRRAAASVASLVLIGILVLVLNAVEPFHRGFFCNDETITYPFKPSTIKSWVLFIVGAIIPTLLILGHSFYLSHRSDWHSVRLVVRRNDQECLKLKAFQVHFLHCMFIFMLGGLVNQAVTDTGKVTVGRLRPNFISVCKPNFTIARCREDSVFERPWRYVTEDICTSGKKKDIRDSRKSWPSGHSSTSVYTMLFAVLYLEHCMIFRRMPGVSYFVNLSLLLLALATCLSRIDDNKHHWTDVLSGSIIGAGVALSVCWLSFPHLDRHLYLPLKQQHEHSIYEHEVLPLRKETRED